MPPDTARVVKPSTVVVGDGVGETVVGDGVADVVDGLTVGLAVGLVDDVEGLGVGLGVGPLAEGEDDGDDVHPARRVTRAAAASAAVRVARTLAGMVRVCSAERPGCAATGAARRGVAARGRMGA